MYECKHSESAHTSSIGVIVTCTLFDCRCEYNGEENDKCKGFMLRDNESNTLEGEKKMSDKFEEDFKKEHNEEFIEEERIYQAECALNDTRIIIEGGRV